MRLDGPAIARFARAAGFAGDQLRTATALALATSAGYPGYEHAVGAPGSGRYVGLWGVDVDRFGDWADLDLHTPQDNARAAYDLTQAHDGFVWSDVWQTGAHRHYRHDAGVAVSRELAPQRLARPVGLDHASHTFEQAADMFRDAIRLCRQADLTRGL